MVIIYIYYGILYATFEPFSMAMIDSSFALIMD